MDILMVASRPVRGHEKPRDAVPVSLDRMSSIFRLKASIWDISRYCRDRRRETSSC